MAPNYGNLLIFCVTNVIVKGTRGKPPAEEMDGLRKRYMSGVWFLGKEKKNKVRMYLKLFLPPSLSHFITFFTFFFFFFSSFLLFFR